ncbi:T3SS effector HopA1 family protein [Sphingomonas alpina]|nr:T3SS effector HopA1 family protein [Sphingomonas alpina]
MNATAQGASRPRWLDDLQPILDTVRIVSPTCFTLAGERVDTTRRPPPSSRDEFFDPDPLMSMLHRRLYATFHAGASCSNDGVAEQQIFVAGLSAANLSVDRWDRGWTVVETLASGGAIVEKRYRTRRANPGEFLSATAPATVVRGTPVEIRVRREARVLQESFYYAFGGELEDDFAGMRSVRYYLNMDAIAAPTVIGMLTGEFTTRAVPFACKCANSPAGFERRDPCVLYVGARHAQLVHYILLSLMPALAPHLRPPVPMLTHRLAPGLGFAEEPPGNDSFGSHRMRAVAHGLITAHKEKRNGVEGRRAAVFDSFAKLGIDLAMPHLSASDADSFGLRRLSFSDGE